MKKTTTTLLSTVISVPPASGALPALTAAACLLHVPGALAFRLHAPHFDASIPSEAAPQIVCGHQQLGDAGQMTGTTGVDLGASACISSTGAGGAPVAKDPAATPSPKVIASGIAAAVPATF